ncbi:MAG: vWA domain-containing protein [Shimia sp.]
MRHLLLSAVVMTGLAPGVRAADCNTDAMLVFDGSGSMAQFQRDPSAPTRIDDARIALARALPDITRLRDVGLVTYGGVGAAACAGVVTHFPPIPDAAGAIVGTVDAMVPGGLTPIAEGLREAALVLSYRDTPGIIVLVTDGNETCGGTPCAVAAGLAREAEDLTIHVVGFRLDRDFFRMDGAEAEPGSATATRCVATTSGGTFVTTETIEELTLALLETLGCSVVGQAQPRGPRHG